VAARVLWDPDDRRLDVLPQRAQKCKALNHILSRVAVRPRQCFVAGDGENDRDLLAGKFPGVVVANAVSELRRAGTGPVWLSAHPGAYGVMDGLRRWYEETDPTNPVSASWVFYG
jgi:hydroxymethylpyrimidine pyrophosphatase-like HAD family hydrolase